LRLFAFFVGDGIRLRGYGSKRRCRIIYASSYRDKDGRAEGRKGGRVEGDRLRDGWTVGGAVGTDAEFREGNERMHWLLLSGDVALTK
jgi:hypothetical protein